MMNVPRRRPSVGAAPSGFATVFPEWNVWDVWQSEDPDESVFDAVMTAGLSLDRQLKIWVENWLKENAAGADVADPNHIGALRGDQVQIIAGPGGLARAETRADVPELGGALQLGEEDSKARKRTVRFYNRGIAAVTTWPSDKNYVLDVVYQPSASNPITSGPAPDSFAGMADHVVKSLGKAAKILLIGGGVALGAVLLINLRKG